MSLQQRAQQVHRQQGQGPQTQQRLVSAQEGGSPIILTSVPYFAIVDGELVNVIGTTDIPGMSPAYWCADQTGVSAPVSVLEAKIFTSAQQALQVLEQGRGYQRQLANQ